MQESQTGALALGSNRNKDGEMARLDSVNYRAVEGTGPHVCASHLVNLLWCLSMEVWGGGNQMTKQEGVTDT